MMSQVEWLKLSKNKQEPGKIIRWFELVSVEGKVKESIRIKALFETRRQFKIWPSSVKNN